MKKSYILLFLLSASAFSQISLSVNLKRSQSEYDANFIVDTLKIFKDNFLYKNIPYPESFVLLENVSNGKYKFCYKNLFGEKVEKLVILNDANNKLGSQEINLYVDQLQNSKSQNQFIKSLKNGEMMTINLRVSGCFNSQSDSIKIYIENNSFFMKYKNKRRKLKTIDIEAIVQYETELRNLPEVDFVSTSNGFNVISKDEEKFSYVEPSLFWGGYEILKKSLKLK